ncbi:unnamed protein product [Pleuronectes platessa]|uniref:Uncharacterized protein n=1 Tax=Pleuronectes platessa TaxID=8262 RepID=A0A9N7UBG4_PLEPL|nr:unnamed protein product [Pleuronectes platessa]
MLRLRLRLRLRLLDTSAADPVSGSPGAAEPCHQNISPEELLSNMEERRSVCEIICSSTCVRSHACVGIISRASTDLRMPCDPDAHRRFSWKMKCAARYSRGAAGKGNFDLQQRNQNKNPPLAAKPAQQEDGVVEERWVRFDSSSFLFVRNKTGITEAARRWRLLMVVLVFGTSSSRSLTDVQS